MTTPITVPDAIRHLLMEEEEVSLPGLGTLRLAPQSASLNSIHGLIAPPAERVEFNDNLVLDDGRLVAALTGVAGREEAEVREELDAFLSNMREILDAGRFFTIEGVGRFSKPHGRQVVFAPTGENFSKASFGLPTLNVQPIRRKEREGATGDPMLGTDTALAQPASAPASSQKSGILYNEELRRWLWIVAGAMAILLILAALFRLGQALLADNNAEEVARIERADPPPRLPADRLNVPPGPARTPVDADRVAPGPPPKLNEADDAAATETDPPPPAPSPDQPTTPPPAAPLPTDNVALIATGMFGSQRNVEKNINRIEAAGFTSFSRPEGRLTRIGVRLDYDTEEELFTALERVRRIFPDSFVMEINGEEQRIE